LTALNVPTGKLSRVGTIHASLAGAPAPAKLTVTLSLQGAEFANDWQIWVYPANVALQPPAAVVVSETWDDAKTALAGGKKVVFFPHATNSRQSLSGSFLPVFWSPVWFPDQKPNTMGLLCDPRHPLLARFPTESYSDWQWFSLMQHARVFVLDDTLANYRPLVQVIDNFARNHKLGVVFEGCVGAGQLLVCGFTLADSPKDAAARQFLASLYHYAGSPAFHPSQELALGLLDNLFVPKLTKLQALGAKIRADSEASGEYGAARAIDGDPDTFWHTPWIGSAPGFPHELVVELATPAKLAGITCLPRQDGNENGWIKDYAVLTSADGQHWSEPVAAGAFKRDARSHVVKFAVTVEARFL
jgi:hypothetical protein